MDFGLLPPEINSGRMYTGAGPGPLLAAAAAWDGLADQLYVTAATHASVISDLSADWHGPSSAAMAAATTPLTSWFSGAAAQAEDTAMRVRVAVAAYETAFAATVPPPVIAANRALLMSLIATNFFGQNAPAIMATEVHYAEMWAQDATAMYGYAGQSATAAQVVPFHPPPRTTNPAGATGQTAAVAHAAETVASTHAQTLPQLLSASPQSLHGLASPHTSAVPAAAATTDPTSVLAALDKYITSPLSPILLNEVVAIPELLGAQGYLLPQALSNLLGDPAAAVPEIVTVGGGSVQGGLDSGTRLVSSAGLDGVSAGMGRADLIGKVSVPQSWTSAAPAIKTAATTVPPSGPAGDAVPMELAADGQQSAVNSMPPPLGGGGQRSVAGGRSAASTRGALAVADRADATNVSNIFVISEVDE